MDPLLIVDRVALRDRLVPGSRRTVGVPVWAMSELSDDELTALAQRLNKFEAADVHKALSEVDAPTTQGPSAPLAASGPVSFGSASSGVLVSRQGVGRYRLRITAAEITGGEYDEFELSAEGLRALVDALVRALRANESSELP